MFERYRVAIIVEPRLSRPLWTWEHWSLIMPHLSAVIAGLSAEAVIRPRQAGNDDNWLAFGRLPWNEKSNRTWTAKYLTDPALAGQVHFMATEIWAPSRTNSFDSRRGPQLFALLDYSEIGSSQGFVLALRKDVLSRVDEAADATLLAVRELPKSASCGLRPPLGRARPFRIDHHRQRARLDEGGRGDGVGRYAPPKPRAGFPLARMI